MPLSACTALTILALLSTPLLAEKPEERPGRIITEFHTELALRGISLFIIRLPLRAELYESPDTPHTKPFDSPSPRTELADWAQKKIEANGIPVINTYHRVRANSIAREIFQEDRFHYQLENYLDPLAVNLFAAYQERHHFAPDDNVLIIGDCFADSFTDAIKAAYPNRPGTVRAFFKLGGGWQIQRQLLLFADDQLSDTNAIIWVLTDRHFANKAFAELPTTLPQDLQPRTIEATVASAPSVTAPEALAMEYPDCLGAAVFLDEKRERFIAHYPIVENRIPLPSSNKFKPNRLVTLRLAPLIDYERTHPKAQQAQIIDPTATDYTTPRYYVLGWVSR